MEAVGVGFRLRGLLVFVARVDGDVASGEQLGQGLLGAGVQRRGATRRR